MGNGPSIEAIRLNLQLDTKGVRKYRNKEEIYERALYLAEHGDRRMQAMREEFDRQRKEMGIDEVWRLDNKEFFENCDKDSYQIAKWIMVLIMDKVGYAIDDKEEEKKNIKKK